MNEKITNDVIIVNIVKNIKRTIDKISFTLTCKRMYSLKNKFDYISSGHHSNIEQFNDVRRMCMLETSIRYYATKIYIKDFYDLEDIESAVQRKQGHPYQVIVYSYYYNDDKMYHLPSIPTLQLTKYDHPFTNTTLFNGLQHLDLGYSFDQPLLPSHIPSTLSSIVFPFNYTHPIQRDLFEHCKPGLLEMDVHVKDQYPFIPPTVTKLTIGNQTDVQWTANGLPVLDDGFEESDEDRVYTIDMARPIIPSTVTHLQIHSIDHYYYTYEVPVTIFLHHSFIHDKLVSLTLEYEFTQGISEETFKNAKSLTYLALLGMFHYIIQPYQLPPSLLTLKLQGETAIIPGVLPNGLLHLFLECDHGNIIETLPPNLQSIYILKWANPQPNVLPSTLTKCTIIQPLFLPPCTPLDLILPNNKNCKASINSVDYLTTLTTTTQSPTCTIKSIIFHSYHQPIEFELIDTIEHLIFKCPVERSNNLILPIKWFKDRSIKLTIQNCTIYICSMNNNLIIQSKEFEGGILSPNTVVEYDGDYTFEFNNNQFIISLIPNDE